jgi:hypothetical protein
MYPGSKPDLKLEEFYKKRNALSLFTNGGNVLTA